MKFIRSLYDWVLRWADTPYGVPALFIIAFAEASFFPIPPDILLIALSLAKSSRAPFFALVSTAGSTLGGMAGYAIGALLWGATSAFFFANVPGFSEQAFLHVQTYFVEYGFWAVFAAGFTPIPYKIFTIASGVFGINFPLFVLASIVSRGLRFFIVAGLIYFFGPTIRTFIDKYFKLLSILFVLMVIAGFYVIKVLH